MPFPNFKSNIFNTDNLATVNKHDFITELKFIRAKLAAEERWSDQSLVRDISWRLQTVLQAAGFA